MVLRLLSEISGFLRSFDNSSPLMVFGLGNRLRGDDIAGLLFTELLRSALSKNCAHFSISAICTEEQISIETFMLLVTQAPSSSFSSSSFSSSSSSASLLSLLKPHCFVCDSLSSPPHHILLVDAATLPSSSVLLLSNEEISAHLDGTHSLSTHTLPLELAVALFQDHGYSLHLLALGVKELTFGAPPSPSLRNLIEQLIQEWLQ